jgi:hypothetical protein
MAIAGISTGGLDSHAADQQLARQAKVVRLDAR